MRPPLGALGLAGQPDLLHDVSALLLAVQHQDGRPKRALPNLLQDVVLLHSGLGFPG